MDINDWRARIDELDRQLVALLQQRAECARAIGDLKRQRDLPIQEPSREEAVFANALAANRAGGSPLSDAAVRRLFDLILAEMRSLQR